MALLSRIKIWVTGEILTASDLNAEFDNIIDSGLTNVNIIGSSADVTAMRVVVDPGEVGSESLASNNTGEVQRLRNLIKEITGKTQWYETPPFNLANTLLTTTATNPSVASGVRLILADTSGGGFTIQKLQNGVANQIVTIYKTDNSNALTIADNGTGSGQAINTHTGIDVVIESTRRGGTDLIFDSAAGFWVMMDRIVSTQDIDSLAVTNAKIGVGAVTADEIGALAVETAKINSLAVTNAKIAVGAVTADELGALAVETTKINSLAVTTAKIADDAVTSAKILINSASDSIASFVTANATFQDSGLSVIIAPDSEAFITLNGQATTAGFLRVDGVDVMELQVQRDGTGIYTTRVKGAATGATTEFPLSIGFQDGGSGSATYTVKIRRVSGSGGSVELIAPLLRVADIR